MAEVVAEQTPQPEFPAKEDPRNPLFGNRITQLLSLMTFREPKDYMQASQMMFPVTAEDLQASPAIRRLLPKVRPSYFDIAITSGSYLPEANPYDNIFGFQLNHVSISICEQAPQVARLIRDFQIDIGAGRASRVDSDYLISAGVSFTRQLRGREMDLLGKRSVTTERVLSELEELCLQQRESFAKFEEQRLQGLHPLDRGLVNALKEVGMRINEGSNNRGFYDDFLLKGLSDKRGRLRVLALYFSAASDRSKTHWKDPKYLNASLAEMPFSWEEDGREVSAVASISKTAVLVKRGGYKRPIRIPTAVGEVHREATLFPNSVSGEATKLFRHFMMKRAGIVSDGVDYPILLATSLPLSPKG